ncbi:formate hydrogenlyase maturation HycH family protein [Paludibacterium yongneupense]|uniref:formate hydrogenlyase maturation HycH family protein n=1 Tax=Paludibacterium yongneupense TaxID=400061 RepID=UPI0003FCF1A1|nr:formate hydrogenlyase maturation HycH family protein [Paludibacterium yongneupense]
MTPDTVVFYSLSRKFLETEEDIPPQAQQVMYYSLAIGHHVGVIDCLKSVLECPLDGFKQWIARIAPGEARRKLDGVLKWGEIAIDVSHIRLLAPALELAQSGLEGEARDWNAQLYALLRAIEAEPMMYLLVRTR